MADTPPKAPGTPPPNGGGNFLTRKLGPLPLWAWGIVAIVGVGIGLYVARRSTSNTTQTNTAANPTSTGVTATPTPDPNIDPNTGIPYAVENATNPATGLPNYNSYVPPTSQASQPSDAQMAQILADLQSIQSYQQNPIKPAPTPTPSPSPKGPGGGIIAPGPGGVKQIPQYVTVSAWQASNTPWNSTLGGIASHYGVSLQRLEQLNPGVSNPNIINVGQRIRVA